MMRKEIRSVRYLSSPHKEEYLISIIEGKPLDSSLCDFKHFAKENYEVYKNHFGDTGSYINIKLTPVFVTPEERMVFDSIESKTKREIEIIIKNIISEMPDQ